MSASPRRQLADVYDAKQAPLRLAPDGTPILGLPRVDASDLHLGGLPTNFWQGIPAGGMTARTIVDRAQLAQGIRSAFILSALKLLEGESDHEAAIAGYMAGQKPVIGEPIALEAIDAGREQLEPVQRFAYDLAFYWSLANASARGIRIAHFTLDGPAAARWSVAEQLIANTDLRALTPERIANALRVSEAVAADAVSIALQALSGRR